MRMNFVIFVQNPEPDTKPQNAADPEQQVDSLLGLPNYINWLKRLVYEII